MVGGSRVCWFERGQSARDDSPVFVVLDTRVADWVGSGIDCSPYECLDQSVWFIGRAGYEGLLESGEPVFQPGWVWHLWHDRGKGKGKARPRVWFVLGCRFDRD